MSHGNNYLCWFLKLSTASQIFQQQSADESTQTNLQPNTNKLVATFANCSKQNVDQNTNVVAEDCKVAPKRTSDLTVSIRAYLCSYGHLRYTLAYMCSWRILRCCYTRNYLFCSCEYYRCTHQYLEETIKIVNTFYPLLVLDVITITILPSPLHLHPQSRRRRHHL